MVERSWPFVGDNARAPSHATVVQGVSGNMSPSRTTVAILNPWDTDSKLSNDPIEFVRLAVEGYTLSRQILANSDWPIIGLEDFYASAVGAEIHKKGDLLEVC